MSQNTTLVAYLIFKFEWFLDEYVAEYYQNAPWHFYLISLLINKSDLLYACFSDFNNGKNRSKILILFSGRENLWVYLPPLVSQPVFWHFKHSVLYMLLGFATFSTSLPLTVFAVLGTTSPVPSALSILSECMYIRGGRLLDVCVGWG